MKAKEFEYKHLNFFTEKQQPLKLNLQFFAEGDPLDPPADPTPPVDPPADPVLPPNDPPTDPPVVKTFTQEEMNRIATKEAKKAQETLLKQLGMTDIKSAKDGLAQLKVMLDAQKTEAQLAAEKAQTLEVEKTNALTRAETLEAEVAALKAEVKPESLSDVIVLARNLVSDDVNIDEAIKQVTEKYPQFKRTTEVTPPVDPKKPKFSNGDHNNNNTQTEADVWANAFKFN